MTAHPVRTRPRPPRLLLAGVAVLALATVVTIIVGIVRPGADPEGEASDGPWRHDAALMQDRDDFGTVVMDGRIWVLGGMTGGRGNKLDSVEVYDPDADSWSSGPPVPTARSNMGTARLGTTIYTFGGSTPDATDAAEALDTRTGTWHKLPPVPTPRYGLAAVAQGGRIYTIGGQRGLQELGTVEVYDPATERWSTGPSLPKARASLRAVAWHDKIYAIGGLDAAGPTRDVQVFDPETGHWSSGPAIPEPISNFGLGVYNGHLHVLLHEHHWTLAAGERRWRSATPMPTSRHGQGVATVAGRMYAIGGCLQQPLRDLNIVESYHLPKAG
ncbi:MAG: Kelch repeat-containing protein [Streptosporangiales bacterium]